MGLEWKGPRLASPLISLFLSLLSEVPGSCVSTEWLIMWLWGPAFTPPFERAAPGQNVPFRAEKVAVGSPKVCLLFLPSPACWFVRGCGPGVSGCLLTLGKRAN